MMSFVFISYSTQDQDYVDRLVQHLRENGFTVWLATDKMQASDQWWAKIVTALRAASAVVVIMTPASGKSNWVEREIMLAEQWGKAIFPLLLSGENFEIFINTHYDDVRGEEMPSASFYSKLGSVVIPDKQAANARAKPVVLDKPSDQRAVEQAMRDKPPPVPEARDQSDSTSTIQAAYIGGVFLLISVVLAGIFGLWQGFFTNNTPEIIVAQRGTQISSPRGTATQHMTSSHTPQISTLVAQLYASATNEQATAYQQATFDTRVTGYAVGTQNLFDQTATALLWTDTPTPNITASVDAYYTQSAATSTRESQRTQNAQATINQQANLDVTATAYLPLQMAIDGVNSNAQWQGLVGRDGYIQQFDSVPMVLVPAGRFTMGSDSSNRFSIDQPFWIDRYEVSNAQYGSIGCKKWSSEPEQPRNCVTWFEAQDHCEARSGRLPTEAEWEYVARGPDALYFPWGNTFIADNVVFINNSEGETAPIGSRPDGLSWVGALDINGNVWEWTLSAYEDYPYNADDGRNDNFDNINISRVLRGGSWIDDRIDNVYRLAWIPNTYDSIAGFRCVRAYES